MITRKFFASLPYWVPVILWLCIIFFLSTLPDDSTPGRNLISDKVLHAAEYFILGFLIFIAIQKTTAAGFFLSFWITLAAGFIYGLSDEIHQLFVPTRHFDLLDLTADVCGILLLFLMLWLLQKAGKKGMGFYRLLSGKEKP